MTCPGSIRLIERLEAEHVIPQHRGSYFAAEGTVAHELRAYCLDLDLDPDDFLGQTWEADGLRCEITSEMCSSLQPGIDWVRERPGEVWIEQRVPLDHWMPGQFGTLDCGIYDRKGRTITINDLKYGAGVPVAAQANKQLMIYALGFWRQFCNADSRIENVVLCIDQPRAGGLKLWNLSLRDLLEFGETVRVAARAVDAAEPVFVASEKGCRWCPVRSTEAGCAAYNRWMTDLIGSRFDDLGEEPALADPDLIDPVRRYNIVRHAHLVTAWLAKLHEDSLKAALSGSPDPGSKAVLGRKGRRRFADTAEAERLLVGALGEAAFTRTLLGVPDAEALLKPGRKKAGDPDTWAALSALVVQSEGVPILVPESDDRPALTPMADLFDEL